MFGHFTTLCMKGLIFCDEKDRNIYLLQIKPHRTLTIILDTIIMYFNQKGSETLSKKQAVRGHSFSTYAKYSEKLIFLTP